MERRLLKTSPFPFVSSEDETPIGRGCLIGLSSSSQSEEVYPELVEGLEANGFKGFCIWP